MAQRTFSIILLLALAGISSGCSHAGPNRVVPSTSEAARQVVRAGIGTYIKHVVIIVQENRSFDNLFMGYPGANTQNYGFLHNGAKVTLHPFPLGQYTDINHLYPQAWAAYDNGKMDGFDLNDFQSTHALVGKLPYAYVPKSDVTPYWAMAGQYVLADDMFPTMLSASYTSHYDLIASTTNLSPTKAVIDEPTNFPWGCDAPSGTVTELIDNNRHETYNGPFPCFKQIRTMASTLDAAGVSWKYYVPALSAEGTLWNEFDDVPYVRYGNDWTNDIISPQTTVLTDAAAGNLPSVSWVIPDYADSDHTQSGSNTGPSWVASVVNAIGQGPDWNTTAIFVVWDDWGGWFDHVAPPQLDFKGLGIRVPCLIVSPYARQGIVLHNRYEFGSLLKFVEDTFGLPRLGSAAGGYTDGRAASPIAAFNFAQPPRTFTPFAAKYPASYFLHRKPSGKPVDTE